MINLFVELTKFISTNWTGQVLEVTVTHGNCADDDLLLLLFLFCCFLRLILNLITDNPICLFKIPFSALSSFSIVLFSSLYPEKEMIL